jgi:nicotinate-nucleotide pyrophosphorylase (carboxylating)
MEDKLVSNRISHVKALLPEELRHPAVIASLKLALAEDLDAAADFSSLWPQPANKDISSLATMAEDSVLEGRIVSKAEGVIAGINVAQAVFCLVDDRVQFKLNCSDGQLVMPGTLLAEVKGNGRSILAGERTALNYLGRMSGIATLARRFVDAITGTRAIILDTRKTAPGLRILDKYAVKTGGAQNHRTGLFDMVMIKDNHIDGAAGIENAVAKVRNRFGSQYPIEVEVKNLKELQIALSQGVDRIMLDNMSLDDMRRAVQITAGHVKLEASGNVTLTSVRAIAETGVDYISSGALTHSAPVLDISMRLK